VEGKEVAQLKPKDLSLFLGDPRFYSYKYGLDIPFEGHLYVPMHKARLMKEYNEMGVMAGIDQFDFGTFMGFCWALFLVFEMCCLFFSRFIFVNVLKFEFTP